MKDLIGTLLGGRYEIKEIIGKGGMSIVYKAYDTSENRYVAVKILKDEYVSDARFRKRFLNESRAIAMLSHHNIVDVYDVNFEGSVQYIVMEYIDGRTLKEYIEYAGALSVPEAIGYSKQILKALRHAHERGVVHRDVKPHNIMLLDDGTIKVTDFGIAHVSNFETVTMTDTAIGSVHYISPEQAKGLATDERSDIYSTGVMLYEMLTGQLPFTGDSAVAVALKQVQNAPKAPHEINTDIPKGLEQIILRAMMKNPEKRYQHVKEMLVDLRIIENDRSFEFNYDLSEDLHPVVKDNPNVAAPINKDNASEKKTDMLNHDGKKGTDPRKHPESLQKKPAKKISKKQYRWRMFRNRILSAVAGIVLALILVSIGYGAMNAAVRTFRQELVTIPSFIGQPADNIINDAKYKANFEFKTTTEYNSVYGEGLIVSQSPEADSEYPSGTTITLVVSKGKRSAAIPNVVGMTEDLAANALKQRNFLFEVVREEDNTVASGTVLRMEPEAGKSAFEGSTIKIIVSFNSFSEQIYMPNLVGETKSNAIVILNNKNLFYSIIEEYSDTCPAGSVARQDIPADTVIEQNTIVTLYISLGKQKTEAPTEEIAE